MDGRDLPAAEVDLVCAEGRLAGEEVSDEDALDRAVERVLLRREAQRLGVAADSRAVEWRTTALAADLGGTAALEAALRRAGMTRPQLRRSLAAAVLFDAVSRVKFADRRADVSDARAFYRRRPDLFTTPAAVDLGAIVVRNRGIAGNALARLSAGRPFEEVARQFSVDPELKDKQGRLGWTDPRSLPDDLRAVVGGLAASEVSRPVDGAGGVWIVKLFDRRPARLTPFADVRADLVRGLTARRRARALEGWLRRAREGAAVVPR